MAKRSEELEREYERIVEEGRQLTIRSLGERQLYGETSTKLTLEIREQQAEEFMACGRYAEALHWEKLYRWPQVPLRGGVVNISLPEGSLIVEGD